MIRCASVSSYMGPYISNYILSELALEKEFHKRGDYIIHIFPKDVEGKEWVQLFKSLDAKLYFIDYRPKTYWSIKLLRSIFKKEKVNIIHCHFGGWDMDVKLAAPFTPTIWHQRMFVNLNTTKRRVKYWLKYNILGMFNTQNIAISDAVYEAITSITNKKTFCVPNCIDFQRLSPDLSYRLLKKDNNHIWKVLLFGYSPYVKGLDVAYKACELLNKEGKQIELNVVSQDISDKYIEDNYTPLPGWFKVLKPSNNVSEYYNQSDIFLSASRSEGFSNSLLEAIYCGCPAVYSDIPGTKWAREFGQTYEYEVESSDSLASAILKSISMPISVDVIENNQKIALQTYSIDSWTKYIYIILSDFYKR